MWPYERMTFDGQYVNEGIVTRPFHGARFDATTGKNVKEPVLTPSQLIKTCDQDI